MSGSSQDSAAASEARGRRRLRPRPDGHQTVKLQPVGEPMLSGRLSGSVAVSEPFEAEIEWDEMGNILAVRRKDLEREDGSGANEAAGRAQPVEPPAVQPAVTPPSDNGIAAGGEARQRGESPCP